MVVPLVMLVILGFVVIRSLMIVVGREKAMPTAGTASSQVTVGGPAPQLRARSDDGVRGLLLPASPDAELIDDAAISDDLVRDISDR